MLKKSQFALILLKQKHVFMFQPMRGTDTQQSSMFSYLSPEERVPADHPLRPIRLMVDDALKALSPAFSRLHSGPSAGHRFRQRSCCEHCFCRCCIRFAANEC